MPPERPVSAQKPVVWPESKDQYAGSHFLFSTKRKVGEAQNLADLAKPGIP